MPLSKLRIRLPVVKDVLRIHDFITQYSGANLHTTRHGFSIYMVLVQHFGRTCSILEDEEGRMRGFYMAYLLPDHQGDTLFGFQAMIDPSLQRRGVLHTFIQEVISRLECAKVRYYEGHIASANRPVLQTHERMAERWGTKMVTKEYPREVMPKDFGRKAVRIGPFDRRHVVSFPPFDSGLFLNDAKL